MHRPAPALSGWMQSHCTHSVVSVTFRAHLRLARWPNDRPSLGDGGSMPSIDGARLPLLGAPWPPQHDPDEGPLQASLMHLPALRSEHRSRGTEPRGASCAQHCSLVPPAARPVHPASALHSLSPLPGGHFSTVGLAARGLPGDVMANSRRLAHPRDF